MLYRRLLLIEVRKCGYKIEEELIERDYGIIRYYSNLFARKLFRSIYERNVTILNRIQRELIINFIDNTSRVRYTEKLLRHRPNKFVSHVS